jgi:hypothetical protein
MGEEVSMTNTEEALFADARAALMFAMRYSNAQFATSILGCLAQGEAIGRGRGLHGLDGSATAGILKARLERLGAHQSAALIARCAAVASAPWLAAVSEITGLLLSTEAGRAIDFEVLSSAIEKHFGRRETVERIASRAGVHRVTANRQMLAIRPDLERIEAQSWADWESSLRDAGLI